MLLVAQPILGSEERAALSDVVDRGWITMGDRVRAFEQAFAAMHGAADAVAVSSCTAALHLILQALGIGPTDEVLVPSLTFVATVNCVLYTGATLVFIDIEALDWPLLSRADAAAKCTAKTKAVIVMHYAGYLAERQAWRDFASSRNLLLIEDAAHAVGCELAGSFGQAAAFSLYGNKNMTTAEGGVITSPDADLLEKVRRMRSHGMTSSTFQRYASRSVGYDVTMLGYNYRMDELRAAVGLAQLTRLTAWNEKRRILTNLYIQALRQHCPGVGLPFAQPQSQRQCAASHHIMPIILPEGVDRHVVARELRDRGIQTSNHYPAAHRLSFYRRQFPSVELPRTEQFAAREVTLPLHPGMEEWQPERVAMALATVLRD
jgi:dTDP-4-amino-4,6-dideoxygalactose transaminase